MSMGMVFLVALAAVYTLYFICLALGVDTDRAIQNYGNVDMSEEEVPFHVKRILHARYPQIPAQSD